MPSPGLVPHGPDHDGRMVLVPLDHALNAIQMSRLPVGIVGQPVVNIVAVVVAFDVGFVEHIQSVSVAQIVPDGVVRVVDWCGRR